VIDHLELSGEFFADFVESIRVMWNVMYANKASIPEECYDKVLEELGKCYGIVRNIAIVAGKPHDFDIKDFDASGSN
jgi:hypothetical protein